MITYRPPLFILTNEPLPIRYSIQEDMPPKSTCTVTPTAAGCHPQRGARAHSDQSREEWTARLERGPNSKESDLEAHQRASLSEDEAVEMIDPKAMMTEDLR
jgi:hypothetical protein